MEGKFSSKISAKVAQSVEHTPEKRGVASSILALGMFFYRREKKPSIDHRLCTIDPDVYGLGVKSQKRRWFIVDGR